METTTLETITTVPASDQQRKIWDVQVRREVDARALVNQLQAATVIAEHANQPDVADALLKLHHIAICRLQALEHSADN